MEGQQLGAILDQAFGGFRVFRLEGFDEQIEGLVGIFARLGLPDIMQHFLGLGLGALGGVVQYIACFVHPAPLLARGWENLFQRRPEPHGTVTGGPFQDGQTTHLES